MAYWRHSRSGCCGGPLRRRYRPDKDSAKASRTRRGVQLTTGRRYRRAGTSGPRGGTRIASGKWPLPSGRGPETYGPGAATDRRPRDSTGAAGRRHAGLTLAAKPRDGHDTVSVTA